MAKCSICNSRKGKRKCKDESFVCSLCCGQSRSTDKCAGCSFFQVASVARNYRKIPFYETQQMSDSLELQDIANVIESILCSFDLDKEDKFTDLMASKLLELFFDKYHFKDTELVFDSDALKDRFARMSEMLVEDLPNIPEEQLIKILASVYRSIQRRTSGGREYLHFAQQFVGARVGAGARVLTR